MEIRQLRYFTTVCAERSFSRAAVKLHMTQPPLSTSVAALERELGVKLLQRTQHGVIPTEAGRYLALRGQQILSQAEQAETHLRSIGEGKEGHLTVAAAPTFAWEFIPILLRRFTSLAPSADITLTDPGAESAVEAVIRGAADIGIVVTSDAAQLGAMYASELHVLAVLDLPMLAVLPPAWESSPDPLDALELRDQTWFLPSKSSRFPGLGEMFEALWSGWTDAPLRYREVSTLQTAVPLVAGGLGVSLMPATIRQFQHRQIVTRTLVQHVPPMQGAVLWRNDIDLTPVQRRFLDLVVELRDDPDGRIIDDPTRERGSSPPESG